MRPAMLPKSRTSPSLLILLCLVSTIAGAAVGYSQRLSHQLSLTEEAVEIQASKIRRLKHHAESVITIDNIGVIATGNHHRLTELGGINGRVEDIGKDVNACHERLDRLMNILEGNGHKYFRTLPAIMRPNR